MDVTSIITILVVLGVCVLFGVLSVRANRGR